MDKPKGTSSFITDPAAPPAQRREAESEDGGTYGNSIFITDPAASPAQRPGADFVVGGTYQTASYSGGGVYIKCVIVHPNGSTYTQGPTPYPAAPSGASWQAHFYLVPPTGGNGYGHLTAHLLDAGNEALCAAAGPVELQLT